MYCKVGIILFIMKSVSKLLHKQVESYGIDGHFLCLKENTTES